MRILAITLVFPIGRNWNGSDYFPIPDYRRSDLGLFFWPLLLIPVMKVRQMVKRTIDVRHGGIFFLENHHAKLGSGTHLFSLFSRLAALDLPLPMAIQTHCHLPLTLRRSRIRNRTLAVAMRYTRYLTRYLLGFCFIRELPVMCFGAGLFILSTRIRLSLCNKVP